MLEARYGKGCFMERAGIRKISKEEEQKMLRTIKGFKKTRQNYNISSYQREKKWWESNNRKWS